jgi:GTP-binding protein
MPEPLIAIVGAPNVGKSTLFNRLAGGRRALVTGEPGMTRDRQYAAVADARVPFRIVDTGGLPPDPDAPFAREIERQVEIALGEASAVLFLVDTRAGATALDEELAARLRRVGIPLLLVANKVDGDALELRMHELRRLGLGAPIGVSAEHGRGIEELFEAIERLLLERFGPSEAPVEDEGALRLAIVGRPNVGKSSIFNRLCGTERAIVSDVPGTTHDAVDTLLQVDGRRYRLIDTAGLRRPGRVQRVTERFSAARARENIEHCDVALLVVDAEAGFLAQDGHVAGHVREAYRPMVVAVNKWDLVTDREAAAKRWEADVRRRLRFAGEVPLVLVSALTGQRVRRVLDLALALHEAAGIRVPTPELNRWLREQIAGDPAAPPPRGQLRLLYATQTGTHPPTFLLFCNDPSLAHPSVRRQLVNRLRERFGFGSTPIRLRLRARDRDRARSR